jgi:MFS family permease
MPSRSVDAKDWNPRLKALLAVLCAALFLDSMDVSMVGVALASIRTDLHLSISTLQWVVSAYVLGYGGFLLLGGRAADRLGRREMFLLSLLVLFPAPLAVAALVGGVLLVPRGDQHRRPRASYDVLGAGTVTVRWSG